MLDGMLTNCVCLSEKPEAALVKRMFMMMPVTTTKSGVGITFNFLAKGCWSRMMITKETTEISIAPIVMW